VIGPMSWLNIVIRMESIKGKEYHRMTAAGKQFV